MDQLQVGEKAQIRTTDPSIFGPNITKNRKKPSQRKGVINVSS